MQRAAAEGRPQTSAFAAGRVPETVFDSGPRQVETTDGAQHADQVVDVMPDEHAIVRCPSQELAHGRRIVDDRPDIQLWIPVQRGRVTQGHVPVEVLIELQSGAELFLDGIKQKSQGCSQLNDRDVGFVHQRTVSRSLARRSICHPTTRTVMPRPARFLMLSLTSCWRDSRG